jgi:predicted Zn-dependent protease
MKLHATIRVLACAATLHAGLSLAAGAASDAVPAAASAVAPAAKAELKNDVKAGAKPETKADSKPADPKPDLAANIKADVKAVAQGTAQPQSAPVPASASASASASTSASASAASQATPVQPPETQRVPPPYTAPSAQISFGDTAQFRNLISSATLEQESANAYAQILHDAAFTDHLLGSNAPLVKRAREIAEREIPFALKWNDRAKNWKWEINVVRSNDIRIYCLPGGKILIYSGLVDKLHLNDNELAMMLGHEIAHALREHARDRLGRLQAAQLSTGTMPQLFGFTDPESPPMGIGEQLLAMRYSPADETEADVIGSEIASRAGYDPRAAVTLWKKIDAHTRRADNGLIWMHPYGPARLQDLIKRLPDMMPLYAKAIGKTVDQLPTYAGMGRFKKAQL